MAEKEGGEEIQRAPPPPQAEMGEWHISRQKGNGSRKGQDKDMEE